MSVVKKDPDFSALSVPLNAAAKIIASNSGRTWNRTIVVTLTVAKDEYHIGPHHCRINPRTIVSGDILKIITRIFELSDTLEEVKASKRIEAIAYEKEQVIKKMTYLRRALENGGYEHFVDDLSAITKEDNLVEIPETGHALVRFSECPRPFMWRNG